MDAIPKIIQKLDPKKAHGHDMISICMLKICHNSIDEPLQQLISRSCIENEKFPFEWKKANLALFHKKGNKQFLKDYHPISGLPICGKGFKCLIYDSILEFFIESEPISSNQSDFKSDDSCLNQPLPITHEI